ncbi:SUF system Fe-S cluster assembly regulator [Colwellia psychrerythraea]|uniref:SUF system Fe-S cluster assembly regulator n=1 Tax=Colwellia psychrerythraea TaxID=28229 RepID=A0A1Y5DWE6_COLPS|nr:SUF system Fe-S cluster assembly regulator [Colwellia psychrerythraea]
MLRVNKLTDYGSVILVYLARYPGEKISAVSLAKAVFLPPATVSNLLKKMVNNELLCSTLGKHGGYQLARPAEQISLAEIITALEGPIALTECNVKKGLCRTEEHCDIRNNWRNINQMVYQSLTQVSLKQMLPPENSAIKPITLIG